MAGRANQRTHGRGGRGAGGGRGARKARGGNTSSASIQTRGQCAALGNHTFEYGIRGAAEKARKSYEKLVTHCGTTMGIDISCELSTRAQFIVPEPAYPQSATATIQAGTPRRDAAHARLQAAREAKKAQLEAQLDEEPDDVDIILELAKLLNEMAEADYQASLPVKVELDGEEKDRYSNESKASSYRKTNLVKHRGQAFAMISGQCTQLLIDKMKCDKDHDTVMRSSDPLKLYALIEKTIMAQSEDEYPFETVYVCEQRFYSGQQGDLLNHRFYDKFNVQCDVDKAVGIERVHPTLINYMTEQSYK